MQREKERFLARTPKSAALFENAKKVMPGGVPMSWMSKWPGEYPTFVASANGARFTDVDGNEYVDLCFPVTILYGYGMHSGDVKGCAVGGDDVS